MRPAHRGFTWTERRLGSGSTDATPEFQNGAAPAEVIADSETATATSLLLPFSKSLLPPQLSIRVDLALRAIPV